MIKCSKCNSDVVEGKIKDNKLIIVGDIKGTIRRNNSNNPKKWDIICSNCQRKENSK